MIRIGVNVVGFQSLDAAFQKQYRTGFVRLYRLKQTIGSEVHDYSGALGFSFEGWSLLDDLLLEQDF